MEFGLNEDQRLLKETAREFLKIECPRSHVRAMMNDPRGYAPELWKKMADLGWMGLAIPQPYGGEGLDLLSLMALIDEMGRALLPGPFVTNVVGGALTVSAAGSEAQKKALLPKVAKGELIMALAVGSDNGRLDAGGIGVKATLQGAGYALNGSVRMVPDLQVADLFLCAARTSGGQDSEDGITMFVVDPRTPGVKVTPLKETDGRKVANLELSGVRVGQGEVVGEANKGWPIVAAANRRLTVALCAEALGGAGAAMELSVEYAKTRVAFGRPIGTFQAIKHKCANMLVDVESARSLVYYAAWALDPGAPDAEYAVSAAKAWCSDAYARVTADGIQVHGGIGMTWEHDMHLFFKRAKVIEATLGDADYHRELVARALGREADARLAAKRV